MQRGECSRGGCEQFSVSISNGEIGLTVRFEDAWEFERFVREGQAMLTPPPPVPSLPFNVLEP